MPIHAKALRPLWHKCSSSDIKKDAADDDPCKSSFIFPKPFLLARLDHEHAWYQKEAKAG